MGEGEAWPTGEGELLVVGGAGVPSLGPLGWLVFVLPFGTMIAMPTPQAPITRTSPTMMPTTSSQGVR